MAAQEPAQHQNGHGLQGVWLQGLQHGDMQAADAHTPEPAQTSASLQVAIPAASLMQHDTTGTGSESCFEHVDVEHILLQLALGHSLHATRSPLAQLPREVLQHHLGNQVKCLFVQDLRCRGLLTPVPVEIADANPEVGAVQAPTAVSRVPPPIARKVRVRMAREPNGHFKRPHLHFPNFGECEDDDARTALAKVMLRATFATLPLSLSTMTNPSSSVHVAQSLVEQPECN